MGDYVSRRRGKGYTQKTDRAGNVHIFTEEEYKGSHGHRVVGPDGRTTYERPQGTFRSRQLAASVKSGRPVRTGAPSFFRPRAAKPANSWGSRGALSPFPEESDTEEQKKMRKKTV